MIDDFWNRVHAAAVAVVLVAPGAAVTQAQAEIGRLDRGTACFERTNGTETRGFFVPTGGALEPGPPD